MSIYPRVYILEDSRMYILQVEDFFYTSIHITCYINVRVAYITLVLSNFLYYVYLAAISCYRTYSLCQVVIFCFVFVIL